jgi:hypothetical protein
MSIFGKALRGFGMLKKTSSAKKKFDAKRKVFGDATFKNDVSQTMKKGSRVLGEFSKSLKKATENSKKITEVIKKKD